MQYFLLCNPIEKKLRCLVDCREYLQVITLTDITSADGKEIMLQAWQGRVYKRKVFSYLWSRQSPRKKLECDPLGQTLAPILHNTTNRTLNIRWAGGTKKPFTTGNGFTPSLQINYMSDMAKFTKTML